MNAQQRGFVVRYGLVHVGVPTSLRGIDGGFICPPSGNACDHHGHLYQHPTDYWLICMNCLSLWLCEGGDFVPTPATLGRQAGWRTQKAQMERHEELLRGIRDCWPLG